ncbi:hypothetical protein E2C01_075900 [Portunus trituberculatus]|uniref:Uncharacterized protein n=1 Tax=Portunus trituberculatus TaxID=210409 RepID=A0A5B7ILS6_PORTR|nr:hypothetical protein [Portunus trituberculatus]
MEGCSTSLAKIVPLMSAPTVNKYRISSEAQQNMMHFVCHETSHMTGIFPATYNIYAHNKFPKNTEMLECTK